MINYQTEVVINRPVEEVFRALSDANLYEKWTEMTGTRLLTDGGLKQGAQVETTIRFGPSKQNMTFEVVAFEPNRHIAWKTVSNGAVAWDAEFTVEPQGEASARVANRGQIRLGGALKLTEPLLAGEVRSGEEKELVRFKELVEGKK